MPPGLDKLSGVRSRFGMPVLRAAPQKEVAESMREGSSRLFMGFGRKEAAPPAAVPSGPTELSKLLCATRMRLGKDLQRVADILHIRYNYLVAIEDGRYEDLPGQAYAIGFVRAYADHLGLDGDEIVRRYKEETAGVPSQKPVFELQVPNSDSALPSGTLLLIAVVAGMLVYGLWYALAGSDRSAVELIQEVPDRLAAIADPNTIQAALPVTAMPSVGESGGEDMLAASPLAPGPAAAAPPAEAVAASEPNAAPAPVSPATTPPPAPGQPAVTDVLELRAKADVWITLRDAKMVERTQFLRKEEVLRLPEQGTTTLVTANAGDLEILVNGKAMPPLDAGLFARGVALDPQKLKSAVAAPLLAPPAAAKPAVPSAPTAVPPAAGPPATAPAPAAAGPAPAKPAADMPAGASSAPPVTPPSQ